MTEMQTTHQGTIELNKLGGLLTGVLPTTIVLLAINFSEMLTSALGSIRLQFAVNTVEQDGATYKIGEDYIAIQAIHCKSGDGRQYLIQTDDGFPIQSIKARKALLAMMTAIDAAAFHGKYGTMTALATNSTKGGTYLLVDVTKQVVTALPTKDNKRVRMATYLPGNGTIAYSTKDGEIWTIDTENLTALLNGEDEITVTYTGVKLADGMVLGATRYYRKDGDTSAVQFGVNIRTAGGNTMVQFVKGQLTDGGEWTFEIGASYDTENLRIAGLEGVSPWEHDNVGLSGFQHTDDGLKVVIGDGEIFTKHGLPTETIDQVGRTMAEPIRHAIAA